MDAPTSEHEPQRAHGHLHAHGHGFDLDTPPTVARVLWVAVVACGLITVVGLAVLWPRGEREASDPLLLQADPVAATVESELVAACSFDPDEMCRHYAVEVREGPDRGGIFEWEYGPESDLRAGDDILVIASEVGDGEVAYDFYDHPRGRPMIVLAVIFALAVLALGRLRGLGALGGLAASLVVVTVFLIPSMLDGNNALAVALVGSSAVAFIAIYLAHGVNVASTVALLSTFASLAITGILAYVFVRVTRLTGMTDDSSFMLDALGVPIDARGILLAGIVIGALGVLDDVTVTQVSAVAQLRKADPTATLRQLYASAVTVGRDHISSATNTLLLAYVGAALPLLLLFTEARQSVLSVATREIVATEIVRTLVGSVGLVASVPIATGLAALAFTRARSPS